MVTALLVVLGLVILVKGQIPLGRITFPTPIGVKWHSIPGWMTRVSGALLIVFALSNNYIVGILALLLLFLAMAFSLSGKTQ